jgi:CBS domain-containing protein
MRLKDVMTTDVQTVSSDTSICDAAKKMKQIDIGPLPVVDGHAVVGMLTDRDIVVRVVAAGKDPANTAVKEAMSKDVVYCFEDQGVEEAAKLMAEKQIRRLLILNHEDRLAGIVSLGDLAVDTHDTRMSGRILEEVSRPGR